MKDESKNDYYLTLEIDQNDIQTLFTQWIIKYIISFYLLPKILFMLKVIKEKKSFG